MKLNYHPDTDSLYIDLSETPGVDSREIANGVLVDYDAAGNLVGIDIDNASQKVRLERLVLSGFTESVGVTSLRGIARGIDTRVPRDADRT